MSSRGHSHSNASPGAGARAPDPRFLPTPAQIAGLRKDLRATFAVPAPDEPLSPWLLGRLPRATRIPRPRVAFDEPASPCNGKQREDLACWLAELVHLTRVHGMATARLWCDEIRPDIRVASAERHWERVKQTLDRLGVPHKRVEIRENRDSASGRGQQTQYQVGVVMEIGPQDVDVYAARLATGWKKGQKRDGVRGCAIAAGEAA